MGAKYLDASLIEKYMAEVKEIAKRYGYNIKSQS
jgi:hypothetical protein